MQRTPIKIIILNKSFPPYFSATGYHACELALFLHRHFEVDILSLRGKKNEFEHFAIDYEELKRTYLPALYHGKQIVLRMMCAFIESLLLIIVARFKRGDHYIIMSDPPFLMWLSTFFIRSEKRSFWMMDVYPDIFTSAGLVKPTNFFIKRISKRLTTCQPKLFYALGENQERFLSQKYFGRSWSVSWPVGLVNTQNSESSIPSWYSEGLIHMAYIGNLGAAHDIEALLMTAEVLDPQKFRFIISIDTIGRNKLIDLPLKNKNVQFVDYIESSQMKFIDLQIVTLKAAFTHLSVPSKAITSIQHGIPVIFFGDKNSDTWTYVKSVGWHLNSNTTTQEISRFYDSLSRGDIETKQKNTEKLLERFEREKSEAYEKIKVKLIGK